jgi:hypothetical protein
MDSPSNCLRDETIEPWSSYVERLGQCFKANKVDDSLKVASLLSLIGGKTYNLLRTLTSPTKPAEKSYQIIPNVKTGYHRNLGTLD